MPVTELARAAFAAGVDRAWADPRGRHHVGRSASLLKESARASLGASLNCSPEAVIVTLGQADGLRRGLAGLVSAAGDATLVHSAVDHSAVLQTARWHAARGGVVRAIGVDRLGRLDSEAFRAAVDDSSCVVALQLGNHEVGTVNDVSALIAHCRSVGAAVLLDATHAIGRIDVPTGWNALVIDGRQWGAVPGFGALAMAPNTAFEPLGPSAERDEPGSTPLIAAGALALETALREGPADSPRLFDLIDRMRRVIPDRVPDVEVVGDSDRRLPHLLTLSCLYVDGEALLDALDRNGFAVSSGSSCTASTLTPSHVLVAMGALSQGNVRVSLPVGVRESDVDAFLDVLPDAVAQVRADAGVADL